MVWVAAFVAFGIAAAIAAGFVVREARRLAQAPPPPLFDLDEALAWVVDHLDDEVAATLTVDDVKRILAFQVEFFRRTGVMANGSSEQLAAAVAGDDLPATGAVVGGPETVAYIVERSAATGESYLPEQVHPVVECQLAYLAVIGAVGSAADDEDDDEDADGAS